MQQQVRGIDWVNIITGTDFNGDDGRSAPKYFAEIHLVIPLTKAQKDKLEEHASKREMPKLKALLKGRVGDPGKKVKEDIIEALELKP